MKDDYVASKNRVYYNSKLFEDLEATLPSPLMDEIMKAYEEDPERFSISVNEYTAKLLGDVGILKEGEEYKSPYTAVTYDSCTDNRFDLVDHFKQKLIEGTNIEAYPDEMAVIDNILFRMWDLGWLDKLSDAGA